MTRVLASLVACMALGGCARATATPPVPQIGAEACTGEFFLDVHNPLTMAIDVYEGDKTRRNEARHIGTVPPGDARLPIKKPLTRMFALDANGQGLTMDPGATTIRYQTVCIT
jgi:hypothetical protein